MAERSENQAARIISPLLSSPNRRLDLVVDPCEPSIPKVETVLHLQPYSMTKLLILGAGSFAIETLEIAELAGGFEIAGFIVDLDPPKKGAVLAGLPIFSADDFPFQATECLMVAGIVSTRRRRFVEAMEARGFQFATVVHPRAVISPRATIAAGCIVHASAVISSNTTLGGHVIVNRGCLVGHDNRIDRFCTLGPGANLAGALEVDTGAYIGVGAIVRDHVTIGAHAVVGSGAVVVAPVAANTMVLGVPARPVRSGVEGL
jgi:sugar O-acyltransferase (sialic acid O-acetyltransferase NeuD family)